MLTKCKISPFLQNSTTDGMTRFNISVAVKHLRNNTVSKENGFWCKMRKVFKGQPLYSQKFPHGKILSDKWNFVRSLKIYHG